MYTSFYNMPRRNNFMYPRRNFGYQNDRLLGGFAVPFLLGGITGAALTNQPYYYPNNFYYNNYYPYNPYYYPYY